MATCNPNDLLKVASCWICRSPQEMQIAIINLLCQILQNQNPMARCDPDTLLADSKCWVCRMPFELMAIQTQLLCEILQVGTGGACLMSGIGPPVDPGPCPFSLYREGPGPNFGLWIWDGVSAWESAIAHGP